MYYHTLFKGVILWDKRRTTANLIYLFSEVLEKAGQIQPKFLAQEIEAVQHKHRTSKFCNTLLKHCESLIANQSLEDTIDEEAA